VSTYADRNTEEREKQKNPLIQEKRQNYKDTPVFKSKLIHMKNIIILVLVFYSIFCFSEEKTQYASTDMEIKLIAGKNPELTQLSLNSKKVTDAGMEYVGTLTKLTYLHLMDTAVTGKGLKPIKNLSQLKNLILNTFKVTDAGMIYINEIKFLEDLDLEGPEVSDIGIKQLTETN